MLFVLYADLVPYTCYRFLEKCKQEGNGFKNTIVHRIVLGSWIQCGGFDITHHRMPCENYAIPHDRRGVLSMCHTGKHTQNSVQFFITLAPAPWMDTLYVAFGYCNIQISRILILLSLNYRQLIQGAEILREIEKVPTYYESPTVSIEIVNCGEFNLYEQYGAKDTDELDKFISKDFEERDNLKRLDIFDVDSFPDIRRYRRGLYCHQLDMKSYLPGFPSIMSYVEPPGGAVEECERECQCLGSVKGSVDTFRSETATSVTSVSTDAQKVVDKEENKEAQKKGSAGGEIKNNK